MTNPGKTQEYRNVLDEFQAQAPVLTAEQIEGLRTAWYVVSDKISDLYWEDDWIDPETNELTDEASERQAEVTLAALGCAMLSKYGL